MTFKEYWKAKHGSGPASTYGIAKARDAWNAALSEAAKALKHLRILITHLTAWKLLENWRTTNEVHNQ